MTVCIFKIDKTFFKIISVLIVVHEIYLVMSNIFLKGLDTLYSHLSRETMSVISSLLSCTGSL